MQSDFSVNVYTDRPGCSALCSRSPQRGQWSRRRLWIRRTDHYRKKRLDWWARDCATRHYHWRQCCDRRRKRRYTQRSSECHRGGQSGSADTL